MRNLLTLIYGYDSFSSTLAPGLTKAGLIALCEPADTRC